MKHLFLSYSTKDLDYANVLEADLKSNDFVVWRDKSNIRGGEAWQKAIKDALSEAYAVVLIQSPHSETARWVGEEVEYARSQSIPVIPILLDGKPQFGFLQTQYIDVRGHQDGSIPLS